MKTDVYTIYIAALAALCQQDTIVTYARYMTDSDRATIQLLLDTEALIELQAIQRRFCYMARIAIEAGAGITITISPI